MKRFLQFFAGIFLIFTATTLLAQLPPYYNYNTNGTNNSFPFNIAGGKMVQSLYLPADFNQPTPAPSGLITHFWFRVADTYPLAHTYTNLYIRMGRTSITSLPVGTFYTGPMDTVFFRANHTITQAGGTWYQFTLDTPFMYYNDSSLVIEIGQCAVTPGTGFSICYTTLTGNRRTYNTTGCPYVYSGQGAQAYHYGISVVPPLTNPTTICRNGLNKFLLDNSNLYDTISISANSNYMVQSLSVKIDTFTHTWDADVRMYLRHGAVGTRFINFVGGSGDNFIGTVIKDTAGLCQIGGASCNTPPFTGTYAPSVGGSFAGFNNQPMNGTWILHMTDSALGDTGTLKAWCITIRWLDFTSGQTGETTIPSKYMLGQNYPNPFNPSTTIKFGLPKNDNVKLIIYDIMGREVMTLLNEHKTAGIYEVSFDASSLASGVYFYKLETANFVETKKMLLVK